MLIQGGVLRRIHGRPCPLVASGNQHRPPPFPRSPLPRRVKFPTIYHGVDLGNVNPGKIVDVGQCPLATKGINGALPQAREDARKRVGDAFASGDGKRVGKRGATLLFRETTEEGTVTDNNAHVSERVNGMVFNFKVMKGALAFCLVFCLACGRFWWWLVVCFGCFLLLWCC